MSTQWKGRRSFLPVILIIVVTIGVLAGCSGKDEKTFDTLTVSQIGKSIEQAVNLQEMQRGDRNKLQKWYKIDADSLEDFILYTSTSNVKADEMAVLKLKDPGQAETVKGKIEQRVEAQKIKFKDYRPNEYYLIEHHVLKTKGPYIFFAVSNAADQMERAFDANF